MPPPSERLGTRRALIGRGGELADLRSALGGARAGRGRFLLVVGEAGIGKTALLEAFVEEAQATDVRSVMARCRPVGAPPWSLWAQVVRGCAEARPDQDVANLVGPGAPDLSLIAADAVPHPVGPSPAGPPTRDARARLFDSVISFLARVACDGGLLVVLDDLHCAELASLLLLQHAVEELGDSPALIVASYSDVDVRSAPSMQRQLTAVGRRGRRITMSGLNAQETAELMAVTLGRPPTPEHADVTYATSGGNPLFVQEAVESLSDGSVIPEELAGLVRQRLERLPPSTREMLGTAAVLGPDFDVTDLQRASGESEAVLLAMLSEAERGGLLGEASAGRRSFRHPVFQETIYHEIRPSLRTLLHRRAADALEPGGDVWMLAHHAFEAARSGDGRRAYDACSRAGEAAMNVLAFEQAAVQFGRALDAVWIVPPVDERVRHDVLMRLADATLAAGEVAEGRELYRRALKSARVAGSPELVARAVVAYARQPESVDDAALASMLEEARAALGPGDSPLHAHVLLSLAARATTREAQRTLSDEGLEIARRADDEAALQKALAEWHDVNRDPEALDARLTVAQALLDTAVAAGGDMERKVRAELRLACDRFEAGEIAAAADLLDAAQAAASDLRLPSFVSAVSAARAGVALLAGRHDEADQLAESARVEGVRGFEPGVARVHLVQLWALRREQGRYEQMADTARRLGPLGGPTSLARAMAAIALAELGRTEEVRRELDAARRDAIDGRGWARLPEVAMMAEASWLIGDRKLAVNLYDALTRWKGRHVVVGNGACSLGAAGRYLGQLAAIEGRYDEADAHFSAAHTLHERLGAPAWLARGQADHARMLLQRARPGDSDRAHQLIAAAARTHGRHGQLDRAERAANLHGAVPSPNAERRAERGTFRLEGEYWAIGYGGAWTRVRDSKGLRYLVRLLSRPGQEVHALDLVASPGRAAGAGPAADRAAGLDARQGGDAGALLDAKAKAAYKRRLDELREDVAEAEAANDLGRLDRAQREMDFLVAELAAAVGLGGRDRKGASDAERARQSVTRAIKAAVERVAEADPVLGDHLRTTVRTGMYSSYGPDPRTPIEWVT